MSAIMTIKIIKILILKQKVNKPRPTTVCNHEGKHFCRSPISQFKYNRLQFVAQRHCGLRTNSAQFCHPFAPLYPTGVFAVLRPLLQLPLVVDGKLLLSKSYCLRQRVVCSRIAACPLSPSQRPAQLRRQPEKIWPWANRHK